MGRPKKIKAPEEIKPIPSLTPKQEAYCQAFIQTNDKSASYRIAYDADAMNINTVNVKAWELHSNGKITDRITILQNELRERNKIKIDDVLGVLADMIKFDIAEIYDDEGRLKPIKEIPKHHREMISSVKVYEDFMNIGGQREKVGETKEVKILNKLDVIEKFMKHLGAYEKDNQQKAMVLNIDDKKELLAKILQKAKK